MGSTIQAGENCSFGSATETHSHPLLGTLMLLRNGLPSRRPRVSLKGRSRREAGTVSSAAAHGLRCLQESD